MKCLFYVEEGASVGVGHRRRCEALSEELEKRGWQCDFFFPSADVASYDCLVIDSYIISPARVRKFKKQCHSLVGFHDFGEPDRNFSLLISSVYRDDSQLEATRILGGSRYRIIHPEIKKLKPIAIRGSVSSIIVSFGGSDINIHRAHEMTSALSARFSDLHIEAAAGLPGIIAGELFSRADIAVSGGGQTMNELLYLGIPTVVVSLSNNQDAQIEEALAHDAIRRAGNINDTNILEHVAGTISELYSEDSRQIMSEKAKELIDGKGAERIAEAINRDVHENI